MNDQPLNPVAEIEALRTRVAQLEREVALLRQHPDLAQGMKGETLIASLCDGQLSSYAAEHDVEAKNGLKLEVKFSKLNTPNRGSPLRRWNWTKPLGWQDRGKEFDYLLLVGEKDLRYADQYCDDGPYIFFLVPRGMVPTVMTRGATIGGNIQINSNLVKANSTASTALKTFVVSEAQVVAMLGAANAA